jgi:pimeloyl-ACP methyl ester carboxylesterase
MNSQNQNRITAQAATLKSNALTEPLSRRRMLQQTGVALAAFGLLGTTAFRNRSDQPENEATAPLSVKKSANQTTIVLVHGAWADGTGWQEIIPLLEKAGYYVIAVQNPLTGLAEDVANTKRVIDNQTGPIVVVGHSYGGAAITGAAVGNPNVKALVYIAAFAPAVGEPLGLLLQQYPTELGHALAFDNGGYGYIDRAQFHDIFCADVSKKTAQLMAVAQKPAFGGIFEQSLTAAAWEDIPTWYMVAANDKALSPDMERFLANRMGATTVEINSSHVPYISQPNEVFKLIDSAAKAAV